MKKIIALLLVTITIASMFVGCALFEKTSTAHEPILVLEKINPTKNQPDRDILKSAKWTVYYDGTVEYEETYSLRGVCNKKTFMLTREEIEEIDNILYTKKDKENETHLNDTKFRWKFTYLKDNGTVLSEYTLYYDDDKSLTKIVEMLHAHK